MLRIFFWLIIFFAHTTFAQTINTYRISGTVVSTNGELLSGVYISVSPGNKTSITDAKGKFEFYLPEGKYKLAFQHVGMENLVEEIYLNQDLTLNINLEDNAINLKQVEVIAKPIMDVNSVNMGSTTMDLQTLTKLPTFLGEVDVIRSITTLPGVVNAGEGSAGFYVRGGSADQNLVLLDDAPVFNSAHLFGFFSIYNPDALKGFTLYRSGISAQHGSRSSSILDVKLRDGNDEKVKYFAGLSPVTASVGAEGPLTKNTTFLFTGRGAYPDYILRFFPDNDIRNSSGYFYDMNLKIKHNLDKNNQINFSSYYSKDGFKFPYDTLYHWSNLLGSLKWTHIFNNNLSGVFTVAKSVYNNNVEGVQPGNEFVLNTGIDFTQLKSEFNYLGWSGHILDYGAGISNYMINPGDLYTYGNSSINPAVLQPDQGFEVFSYINDEIRINERISINLGLRHTYFAKRGPYDVYVYDESRPRSEHSVVDTLYYARQSNVESYQGLEPRGSIKYSLSRNSSLKAALNRSRQYIQLIFNTAGITPVDVWKLSNNIIKPQIAD